MSDSNHNKILGEVIKICDKKISEKIINTFLKKYDIDINYDNSLILKSACYPGDDEDDPNYHNIKILLDMGANPLPLVDDDIIGSEIHPINRIRLDAIFKMYGYNCDWCKYDSDFEKLGDKMLCKLIESEEESESEESKIAITNKYILTDIHDNNLINFYEFKNMTKIQVSNYIKNNVSKFFQYFQKILFIIHFLLEEEESMDDDQYETFYNEVKSKCNIEKIIFKDNIKNDDIKKISKIIKDVINKKDIFILMNVGIKTINEDRYNITLKHHK